MFKQFLYSDAPRVSKSHNAANYDALITIFKR